MGNRLDQVMERIRAGLDGLPEDTIRRALDYYREFIAEAIEAGRSEDEILQRLGDPGEIIEQIRAEASLAEGKTSTETPGPGVGGPSRTGVTQKTGDTHGRISSGVAHAAGKILLTLGVFPLYLLGIGLYIIAAGTFLSALAAVGLAINGILEIAPGYTWEKVGTAGIGIFVAGIFAATGLLLWMGAAEITRAGCTCFAHGLWRRGIRQGFERNRKPAGLQPGDGRIRKGLKIFTTAALIGLGIAVPTGLPLQYFLIWNSVKPACEVYTETYNAADIREIEVKTLNSMIIAEAGKNSGDSAVRITYEEAAWMRGTFTVNGDKLVFREESRRRLPFLDFVARHEGMTAVKIEIPPGYRARAMTLTSKGGHIAITLPAGDIKARTLTGNIRFDASGGSFALRAVVKNGRIITGGRPLAGGSYTAGNRGENTIEIESTGGTVTIEGMALQVEPGD
ncbi:MAG: DUF1700 domain-containing protein [Clostridia bacterium]|nr:DUF1700 domain-containing protein [Clostridia bacterium]